MHRNAGYTRVLFFASRSPPSGDLGRYPAYASMYRLLIAFLIFTGGCGSPEAHQATSRTPGGWLQTDVVRRKLARRFSKAVETVCVLAVRIDKRSDDSICAAVTACSVL